MISLTVFPVASQADLFSGFSQGQGGSAISGGSGPSGNTSNATPTTQSNTGQSNTSQNSNGNATPTLEKCDKPLGKMAVAEPQDYVLQALQQAGLPKPNGLIRIMIQQSNCFIVVERGVAFQNIQQERALAQGGELRKGSNMGKGQLATADYVMTPEVAFKNNDAGGGGAALGALFGSVGTVVGAGLKFKEAQTTLTVADTRSGIQVASGSGATSKTDWNIGGLLGGGGGSLGLGAYENTAEGKVIAMAFLDAYNNVVNAIRGSKELKRSDKTLKQEAGTVVKAGEVAGQGDIFMPKINGVVVYKKPSKKSGVLSKLKKGEEVIATGEEDGEFIKVTMGSGSEGWVKKSMMTK